jgi:phage portal protein BeeE
MQFQPTATQQQEDAQIDTAIAVGEKMAVLEQAFDELRKALARHCGDALYIYPGTAARAAVEADKRRAAQRRAA